MDSLSRAGCRVVRCDRRGLWRSDKPTGLRLRTAHRRRSRACCPSSTCIVTLVACRWAAGRLPATSAGMGRTGSGCAAWGAPPRSAVPRTDPDNPDRAAHRELADQKGWRCPRTAPVVRRFNTQFFPWTAKSKGTEQQPPSGHRDVPPVRPAGSTGLHWAAWRAIGTTGPPDRPGPRDPVNSGHPPWR